MLHFGKEILISYTAKDAIWKERELGDTYIISKEEVDGDTTYMIP